MKLKKFLLPLAIAILLLAATCAATEERPTPAPAPAPAGPHAVRPEHPRIYLTAEKLADLRARAVPTNTRWTQLLAEADKSDGTPAAQALVYQITGQAAYCDQAISAALDALDDDDYATKAGDLALIYDWCYDRLSASQRDTFIAYFNDWGDAHLADPGDDIPGWGNYWPRYGYSFALVGLATYGDNPRAQEWMDEFRTRRYQDVDLPLLNRIADGGGWPEGTVYDWIANWPRVKALEAWRTATGEDLFQSTAWYRERLGYILLHRLPGQAELWGYVYHPYLSTGDAERNRGPLANYERIMALILISRFPDDPRAQQLQAYLAAPPTDNSDDFLYQEEFLWFDPDQPAITPTLRTHYATALGTVFMRSGWPSGAADTDTSATYLTFQCGDHFSYHQHYDQNSFTLFKYGDLAVDSGVYSGEGLSYHDINYYIRTIAHNTLVVYNPAEDFSDVRAGATSNDGGQRTMYPASRAPMTITYYNEHAVHYETGDILRFDDAPLYTYALGDATAAYNNPAYNQTQDTDRDGNVAKVGRFQREFVYLRPYRHGGDYLVLFDRVTVVSPTFGYSNTKLLFHTLYTPTVAGTGHEVAPGETLYPGADAATITSGDGKLFLAVLLPPEHNLRRVGGRGRRSFWGFDGHYDYHWEADEPQPRPVNDYEDFPYGEWRLELEPADGDLSHNFLTVLHPAVSTTLAMPAATLITGTGVSGVHIADPMLNRVALFSADEEGHALTGTVRYAYTPTTATLNLIFDLRPDQRYTVTAWSAGSPSPLHAPTAMRSNAQGVLSFTLQAASAISVVVEPFVWQPSHWLYLPVVLRDYSPACSDDTASMTNTADPETMTVGEAAVVTVTLHNEGCSALGLIQYRLILEPTTVLSPAHPAPIIHSFALSPGHTDSVTFTLWATATGTVNVHASASFEVMLPSGSYWGYSSAAPLTLTVTAPPTATGGHIVYRLSDADGGHLYRLAAQAGAVPEDISAALDDLSPGTDDEFLNISPDGRWLLLSTDRFGCTGWPCLALVTSGLTATEVISANGAVLHADGFSAVASGGDLVVYPSGDGPHGSDLWAVTRDGGRWLTPTLLTGDSPYAYNAQPALSADGRRVAFDCGDAPYAGAGTALCEVQTDGSGFRVLLTPDQGPGGDDQNALHHPDYTPDGSLIFEADWDGEQIWRLPPGGATSPQLVAAQFSNDNSPCVLPDGRIVSLWLERPGGSGQHEIKVMAADGSASTMVLTGVDVADIGLGCGE